MPYERPTLSDLKTLAAQDIASSLPGTDPLLRFSNLQILGTLLAMFTHLQYGYLDYIAQQMTPFTATGEFLEAWGALVDVFRNPAQQATGIWSFHGGPGVLVPAGTRIVRGDSIQYTTTADAYTSTGIGPYSGGALAIADADPGGLLGANGNCIQATVLTLTAPIAGIDSNGAAGPGGFTGGLDLEADDAFRDRVLFAFQNPPQGGDQDDYIIWAKQGTGVTRAWCCPNLAGPGTVTVYVMLDVAEAIHDGFPQGTNGISQNDKGPGGLPRDVVATGDQLVVADVICAPAPVTALVYVMAPTAQAVPFTIAHSSAWTTATKTAAAQAIADAFFQHAVITGGATVVDLEYVSSAIAAVPGTDGFVITTPSDNIAVSAGALPTVGAITWAA